LKIENSSVLTLADLATWSFDGTALAVLGHPIKHSVSPAMHNAALAELAKSDPRFRSWQYFRFDVPPEDLPRALPLFHARGFRGLNLTVPHKIIAFAEVREIDPAAKLIGAVNTLRRTDEGWFGANTDGYGLSEGLRENLGVQLRGAPVVLLGAGGAARGAAVECLRQRCAALWIGNRTVEKLPALVAELEQEANGVPIRTFEPGQPPKDLAQGSIVINATSAGLRASDTAPIDLGAIPRPAGVYDMIYNPPLTPLLREAQKCGLPFANGLSMLVHQGAKSLLLWTERHSVPVATMRQAAEQALGL
jgi:shikimate dehydrogenase